MFVLDLNEILHRCDSCVKIFCRGASTNELRSQVVGDVAVMAGSVQWIMVVSYLSELFDAGFDVSVIIIGSLYLILVQQYTACQSLWLSLLEITVAVSKDITF